MELCERRFDQGAESAPKSNPAAQEDRVVTGQPRNRLRPAGTPQS